MIDAEEKAAKDGDKQELPSIKELQAEAENKEREGLSNPASLAIFMRWWRWGGAEHGLSLDDCMTQPEWLLHDFEYIHSEMMKEKRRRPKKKVDPKGKRTR